MIASTTAGLADVLREVEDRLSALTGTIGSDDTPVTIDLNLMDRIDVAAATTEHLAHQGIAVRILGSRNLEKYRDDAYARVADSVEVALTYRVRPSAQRNSRDEAIRLEERIRAHLVEHSWGRIVRLAYKGVTYRGAHPKSSEFYLIAQSFETERDAELGGLNA